MRISRPCKTADIAGECDIIGLTNGKSLVRVFRFANDDTNPTGTM